MRPTDFIEPIAITAIIGLFIIARIVATMTKHQQKMAEILHATNGPVNQQMALQLDSLRREVAELKALMVQQVLGRDDLMPRLQERPTPQTMEQVRR